MPPILSADEGASNLSFRNVNGNQLVLYENSSNSCDNKTRNVIRFAICRNERFNVKRNVSLLCLALLFWAALQCVVPFYLFSLILILYYSSFVTSSYKDTLLVVESVGVYIEEQKWLYGLNTSKFLPWDSIADIFINEVITEQRVLYYLTILVKETVYGEEKVKLVPLFRDLKP